MSLRQPWFLVMAPKAANRFGSQWIAYETPPRGDVLGSLLAPKNKHLVAVFGGVWLAAALAIWLWGVGTRTFSLAFATLATVLVTIIVVASFVRLVCVQMIEAPPRDVQSR
jgi:hypothetical protein